MDRKGLIIGFLAGGWMATLALLAVPHLSLPSVSLPEAAAEGGPTIPIPLPLPIPLPPSTGSPGSGPIAPGERDLRDGRSIANPGLGTSDSNHRSIALSASVGSGMSVVYYFDTVANRLCVYQYSPGNRGGLRLLAARLIGYDLKLESYRDLSEKTPAQMRDAYEAAMQARPKNGRNLPTRRVDLPAGSR